MFQFTLAIPRATIAAVSRFMAKQDIRYYINGLHYYHQTDPRGCCLYVSREPMTDSNYNRGIACC